MNKASTPVRSRIRPQFPRIVPMTIVQSPPTSDARGVRTELRLIEVGCPQPSPTKQELRQHLLRMILKNEAARRTPPRRA